MIPKTVVKIKEMRKRKEKKGRRIAITSRKTKRPTKNPLALSESRNS